MRGPLLNGVGPARSSGPTTPGCSISSRQGGRSRFSVWEPLRETSARVESSSSVSAPSRNQTPTHSNCGRHPGSKRLSGLWPPTQTRATTGSQPKTDIMNSHIEFTEGSLTTVITINKRTGLITAREKGRHKKSALTISMSALLAHMRGQRELPGIPEASIPPADRVQSAKAKRAFLTTRYPRPSTPLPEALAQTTPSLACDSHSQLEIPATAYKRVSSGCIPDSESTVEGVVSAFGALVDGQALPESSTTQASSPHPEEPKPTL